MPACARMTSLPQKRESRSLTVTLKFIPDRPLVPFAGLAQPATVPYPVVHDFRTARPEVTRDCPARELDLPADSVHGGVRATVR